MKSSSSLGNVLLELAVSRMVAAFLKISSLLVSLVLLRSLLQWTVVFHPVSLSQHSFVLFTNTFHGSDNDKKGFLIMKYITRYQI